MELKTIAKIRTDFPAKFGLPRQSGIVENLNGTIVFEPDYRHPEALRGLEGYSHLWLIWGFSENFVSARNAEESGWSPTVRPPRLGGNKRVGVFSTRSPNRPNKIGLSCVRLVSVDYKGEDGPVIHVSGIDMMDGTPVYDIKPYIAYCDSHPDAVSGFADAVKDYALKPVIEESILEQIPEQHRESILQILSQDPRPAYQQDEERIYGFRFADMNIRFVVREMDIIIVGIDRIK